MPTTDERAAATAGASTGGTTHGPMRHQPSTATTRRRNVQHDDEDEEGWPWVDDRTPPSTTSRRKRQRGRSRHAWSEEEEWTLLRAVERYGVGQWAEILKDDDYSHELRRRDNVQLKDKWRNMTKNGMDIGIIAGTGGAGGADRRDDDEAVAVAASTVAGRKENVPPQQPPTVVALNRRTNTKGSTSSSGKRSHAAAKSPAGPSASAPAHDDDDEFESPRAVELGDDDDGSGGGPAAMAYGRRMAVSAGGAEATATTARADEEAAVGERRATSEVSAGTVPARPQPQRPPQQPPAAATTAPMSYAEISNALESVPLDPTSYFRRLRPHGSRRRRVAATISGGRPVGVEREELAVGSRQLDGDVDDSAGRQRREEAERSLKRSVENLHEINNLLALVSTNLFPLRQTLERYRVLEADIFEACRGLGIDVSNLVLTRTLEEEEDAGVGVGDNEEDFGDGEAVAAVGGTRGGRSAYHRSELDDEASRPQVPGAAVARPRPAQGAAAEETEVSSAAAVTSTDAIPVAKMPARGEIRTDRTGGVGPTPEEEGIVDEQEEEFQQCQSEDEGGDHQGGGDGDVATEECAVELGGTGTDAEFFTCPAATAAEATAAVDDLPEDNGAHDDADETAAGSKHDPEIAAATEHRPSSSSSVGKKPRRGKRERSRSPNPPPAQGKPNRCRRELSALA